MFDAKSNWTRVGPYTSLVRRCLRVSRWICLLPTYRGRPLKEIREVNISKLLIVVDDLHQLAYNLAHKLSAPTMCALGVIVEDWEKNDNIFKRLLCCTHSSS